MLIILGLFEGFQSCTKLLSESVIYSNLNKMLEMHSSVDSSCLCFIHN